MSESIEKDKKNSTLYFLGLRYSTVQNNKKHKESLIKLKEKDQSNTFEQGLNHKYYNPEHNDNGSNGGDLQPTIKDKKHKK